MSTVLKGFLLIILFAAAAYPQFEFTPSTEGASVVIADDFGEFSDGLCAVKKGDKWGFIDAAGKLVIDYQFDFNTYDYRYPFFTEGLCMLPYSDQGKKAFRYIDKTGKTVFEKKGVMDAVPFSGGYARILEKGKTFRVYLVDQKGKEVKGSSVNYKSFAPQLKYFPYSEGMARYADLETALLGFMDEKGKIIIKPKYEEAEDFSDGLAAVKTKLSTGEYKWGYIDKTGKTAIDFIYSNKPGNFSEGKASVVNKDDLTGVIDKTGKIVIEPQYAWCTKYNKGFAFASIPYNETVMLDAEGKQLIKYDLSELYIQHNIGDSMYVFSTGSGYRWGLMTYDGVIKVPYNAFEYIGKFNDGLAEARGFVNDNRVHGFINPQGNFLIVKGEDQF